MIKSLTRFSIRTLMLATLVLALGLSIVVLLWELVPLRAEVQQLRNEAGYLTIDDPTKVHAIRLETDSPLVWRWKVWVPKGPGIIKVNAMVGDIPALEDYSGFGGGAGVWRKKDFEALVTVMIHQDLHGEWQLSCEIGGARVGQSLTEEQVAVIRDKGGSSRNEVGHFTEVADDSENFILLRERFAPPGARSVDFRDLKTPGDGMIVWLQVEARP